MGNLDKLPVVKTVEGWFWREYRLDGKLIERHSLFRVWWQETRTWLDRLVTSRTFRLGMHLVRHGSSRCKHCGKSTSLRESIE